MQENLKDNNGCSSVNIYVLKIDQNWLCVFEFCTHDCVMLWVPIIIPDDSCWLFHCTQSS